MNSITTDSQGLLPQHQQPFGSNSISEDTQSLINQVRDQALPFCEFRSILSPQNESPVSETDFEGKPGDHMILVYDASQAEHKRTLYHKTDPNSEFIREELPNDSLSTFFNIFESAFAKRLRVKKSFLGHHALMAIWKQSGLLIESTEALATPPYHPVKIVKNQGVETKVHVCVFSSEDGAYVSSGEISTISQSFTETKKCVDDLVNKVNTHCEEVFLTRVKTLFTCTPSPLSQDTSYYITHSMSKTEVTITYLDPCKMETCSDQIILHLDSIERCVENIKHSWEIFHAIKRLDSQRTTYHAPSGNPKELVLQEPFKSHKNTLGILWAFRERKIELFVSDELESPEPIERLCTLGEISRTIRMIEMLKERKRETGLAPVTLDQALRGVTRRGQHELMSVWGEVDECQHSIKRRKTRSQSTVPQLRTEGKYEYWDYNGESYMPIPRKLFPPPPKNPENDHSPVYKVFNLAIRVGEFTSVALEEPLAWMRCRGHLKIKQNGVKEYDSKVCKNELALLEAVKKKNIDQTHIVRMIFAKESADLKGGCLFAFEFCGGGEFTYKNMKEKKFSLLQALDFFKQGAMGFKALHDGEILHCDIKPSNLMLKGDCRGGWILKIIDLGLGVLLDQQNHGGKHKGTPLYFAPEFRNNNLNTKKSDVFSYGLVGREVVEGKVNPFNHLTTIKQLFTELNKDILSFSGVSDTEKAEYPHMDLIYRMTAKNPESRPTMEQIVQDIERILKNEQERRKLESLHEQRNPKHLQ